MICESVYALVSLSCEPRRDSNQTISFGGRSRLGPFDPVVYELLAKAKPPNLEAHERFSWLPPRSIQLLVSGHSKAKIVATSVGDVVGDARDLTDDDEVVSLDFFIDSPVKREGVNEVVVNARGQRADAPGEFHLGGAARTRR